MTLYDKLDLLKPVGENRWAQRLHAELSYAADVSTADGGVYDTYIDKAADYCLEALKNDGAVTKATVLAAEELLAPVAPAAKGYTAHMIGHAHIDMNWEWGYNETAAITVDTFRTVLDLMKEYPDFRFSQSQASTYRIIEENAPEMLDEIKARVHEGRWEVSAGTWVENDKNMPSGESLARHILYAKKYLSKLLDIPADSLQLDFEPDTFGHNISVPEVCAKGGVKYYYHCRGREDAPAAYVWRSRAGHDLLVYNEPSWYNTEVVFGLFRPFPQICARFHSHDFPIVYGVGDHGGGPTRRDIERLLEMSTWPIMPTIKFSTYAAFFAALENSRPFLPVYTKEFNYVFTGCYTSQSRIKMANRIGEDRMYEAEFLSSSAHALAGDARRNPVLAKAWENILFNQFHDILPGSGVIETREYAMGRFQNAMAAIQTAANQSMRAMAAAIDTSSIATNEELLSCSEGAGVGYQVGEGAHFVMPAAARGSGKKRIFHLFNSTQTPFDGVVKIVAWDWNFNVNRAVFTDENGNEVESQFLSKADWFWNHTNKTFAAKVKVPAFGYSTYILNEKEIVSNKLSGCPTDRNDPYSDEAITLENRFLKAVFDHKSMELISLTDKMTGKALISKPSARFLFIKENTIHGATAWRVGDRMKVENLNAEKPVRVDDPSKGLLCRSVRYRLSFGERSDLNVTVSLRENSRLLDFDIAANFHEVGTDAFIPQLCFEAPLSYAVPAYRYDVPFGLIDREPIAHDVPANSFAAALTGEGKDEPVAVLVSDSKYGFRGYADTLSLDLIRGSYDPDPYPEYGMHNIRVGLGIAPNPAAASLYDLTAPFIHPVSVCSARAGKGTLPLRGELLSADGVRVTAIKTCEDEDALIVRVFEPGCKDTSYTLTFPAPIAEACETDLNETPIASLTPADNAVSGEIGAFEVKTLKIKLK